MTPKSMSIFVCRRKIMLKDIERVLVSEQELKEITERLGKQISEDYKDKNLLLVSVLKGSVAFMADLMRNITVPCKIDFMALSTYGSGTESSGRIRVNKDLDIYPEGYDILIVEDILDSGRTLEYVINNMLMTKNAASVRICTLLDKPERRVADVKADYVGTKVPNAFVVGYGLDYDEKYRNLPFIGELKKEVYSD